MNNLLKTCDERHSAANSLLTGFKIAATKDKPTKSSLIKILATYKRCQQDIIDSMETIINELK